MKISEIALLEWQKKYETERSCTKALTKVCFFTSLPVFGMWFSEVQFHQDAKAYQCPIVTTSSSAVRMKQSLLSVDTTLNKSAHPGQTEVVNVEKGWHNIREMKRVVYTPDTTSLKRLTNTLKKSGNYICAIPWDRVISD